MDIPSLIVGAIVGGAISWMISAHFYNRSTSDLRKSLNDHRQREEKKDTLEFFEYMLTQGTWRKEHIDKLATWICDQRSSLRVVIADALEPFDEEWTQRYPDKLAQRCEVELQINGSTVKSLSFILLDGHRTIVPMPRRIVGNGNPLYFWDKESLEYKVGRIVGQYYIHESIEGIAKISDVTILSGPRHI